jgi:hypothetical protein
MAESYLRRGTALAPGQASKRFANPVFVDSATEVLNYATGTSGTTLKQVVDLAATQTLTNKTLTSPTINGATLGTATITAPTITTPTVTSPVITGDASSGVVVAKTISFVEDATSLTHTGSVVLPAGAVLLDIIVSGGVVWTATGTVTLKIGDTAVADGYFIGVNLKATDLLAGETLAISGSNVAASGGKQGSYLVAATGQRGAAATNFGAHNVAGTTINAVVTVVTPATTAGRTYVTVFYAVGQTVTVVKA